MRARRLAATGLEPISYFRICSNETPTLSPSSSDRPPAFPVIADIYSNSHVYIVGFQARHGTIYRGLALGMSYARQNRSAKAISSGPQAAV